MTSFITDGTSLETAKTDLAPIPSGADATKWVKATDWNGHRQSLLDIQSFLRGGFKFYKPTDTSVHAQLIAVGANPNGSITAEKGSLAADVVNAKLYKNTDGTTAWTEIGGPGPGVFGDGSDSTHTLDGSTTVLGMAPSSSKYTAVRNLYFTDLVINSGVTLDMGGFILYVNGTLSGAGHVSANGNNATGASKGAFRTAKILPGSAGGGDGGSAAYGAPGNGGNSTTAPFGSTATGGDGGISGFGLGGGTGGVAGVVTAQTAQFGDLHNREAATAGFLVGYQGGSVGTTSFTTGSGGGGGRGGSNNGGDSTGGGGGGAGAWVVVWARNVTLTGSIDAKGGNGANGGADSDGGGGGGGGGGVAVLVYSGGAAPTMSAAGGTFGSGGPVPDPGGAHGSGAVGLVGSAGFTLAFQV